jgi:Leucine-rich repeat (LRR) protein
MRTTGEPEPTERKPRLKRHWFRVSIRTMLGAVLLLSLCLSWICWKMERARREQSAIRWLEELEGDITYAEYVESGMHWAHLRGDGRLSISLPGLSRLEALETAIFGNQVEVVELSGTEVNDLSPMVALTRLSSLYLTYVSLDDLAPLSEIHTLETIDIEGSNVSDLTPLRKLSNLKQLRIHTANVADLSPLSELKNLESLDLIATPVTDLSPLEGLTRLYHLDIARTNVTDLTPLAQLTNLTSLGLGDCPVTDLSPLQGLKELTYLSLRGSRITDASPLADLANLKTIEIDHFLLRIDSPLVVLKSLETIYIDRHSKEEQLRAVFPNCKIEISALFPER